jgi:hypothetical protein
MTNDLKVKVSTFQTKMTFNEWAQYTKASSLWDEATNEKNKDFVERYRNFKFAEAFPQQKQIHEFAV